MTLVIGKLRREALTGRRLRWRRYRARGRGRGGQAQGRCVSPLGPPPRSTTNWVLTTIEIRFWRPAVQSRGAGRATSSRKAPQGGRFGPLPTRGGGGGRPGLPLARGRITANLRLHGVRPVSLQGLPVAGLSLGLFPSYKDTDHVAFRSHPTPVCPRTNLTPSAKIPLPNEAIFGGSGRM